MLDWRRYQENLKQEFYDLGLGRRVGTEDKYRLLNRDGSFNVRREGLSFFESMTLYQAMLKLSWPKFYLVTLGSYLLINLLFAAGYVALGEGTIIGLRQSGTDVPFLDAFFFSVQVFTTVGFGQMVPHGLAGNILFTFESFAGLLGFALVTGFSFARFSKPHARIAFSEKALIAPYRDGTAFMFRIANKRRSQLVELSAQVVYTCTKEGQREYFNLNLERDKITFFPLHWTIVHPITEDSPLAGKAAKELVEDDAEILILLSGFEETFSQTVHTRSSYKHDEIVCGARFTDIYRMKEDGRLGIDMQGLSDYESL